MNTDRGGRGRRGRPRPARRGGRAFPKPSRSASPPAAATAIISDSVKLAASNDVAVLQRIWPEERERILRFPPCFHSRSPDFQARET
ncbi:hypothetical protein BVRB_039240 [Beta vulgaris subsp. vulgaris]|uniref:Uncharacterized protein n=1 Tax=Beta vulgaris subsp. vulgaris TaxID=3555 RepID=A0A0J8BHC1_BETVV|nr:hypothetical protein BVRB_039240 [Beta vulgaris subsp. vulgaris]